MVTDPARPTIRCLLDDLANSVTDARQRSALLAGQLPDLSVQLHEIAHPIVAAARDRYTNGEPRARDWFRSVRDQPWVECRHGERWRGLVLWYPQAQRWLCFAGWHEFGSRDDVYERFTQQCTTGSTIDSTRFLPVKDDESRLLGEQRYSDLLTQKQRFNHEVLKCLLSAVSSPGIASTLELPDGSTMRVLLRPDGDLDELTLQIKLDWRGGQGAAMVERVKDTVPGIATNEWDIIPPGPTDLDPIFLAYVDDQWVTQLTEAAATHGLEVLGANPNLLLDRSDGAAHFIPASAKVATAYVEGQPVRAICGRRFVPTADPSTAPTCPECQRIREQIEQAHRVD